MSRTAKPKPNTREADMVFTLKSPVEKSCRPCSWLGPTRRGPLESLILENHYTHSLPSGLSHYFKVDNAIVVYSIPANKNISKFLLGYASNVWELTRLWAPDGHEPNLLTRAIALSVIYLSEIEPSIEALVSYADPNQGHRGGIYRAASWVYTGQSTESRYYVGPDGQSVARRKFHSGSKLLHKSEIEELGFQELKRPGKHRFARGLTYKARKLIRERFSHDQEAKP